MAASVRTHQWHGTCRYLLRRNSCEPPLQHRPNPEIRRVSINKTFAARTRDGKCVQPQVLFVEELAASFAYMYRSSPSFVILRFFQVSPKSYIFNTVLCDLFLQACYGIVCRATQMTQTAMAPILTIWLRPQWLPSINPYLRVTIWLEGSGDVTAPATFAWPFCSRARKAV